MGAVELLGSLLKHHLSQRQTLGTNRQEERQEQDSELP